MCEAELNKHTDGKYCSEMISRKILTSFAELACFISVHSENGAILFLLNFVYPRAELNLQPCFSKHMEMCGFYIHLLNFSLF